MDRPESVLARLRALRVRPDTAVRAGDAIEPIRRELDRRRRSAGAVLDAWASVAPEEVRAGVRVVGVRNGVLLLASASSSRRYRLDRWLRSGGEARLREAAAGAFRGVRVAARG